MNWYYALNGQQMGPISDMEFTTLVREGTITGSTLVWQEGMEKWEPLQIARADLLENASSPVIAGMAVDEQNKDLLVQQLREGATAVLGTTITGTGLRYAGFWIRFAAKLIDYVLLWVLTTIAGFLLGIGAFSLSGATGDDPAAAMAFAVMNIVLSLGMYVFFALYNGIMVVKWGGSLGKLAVGLRVVTEEGQKLTSGRSIGRGFADIISIMVCSLPYLMVAFDDPQRRALHDHICATRVVYK